MTDSDHDASSGRDTQSICGNNAPSIVSLQLASIKYDATAREKSFTRLGAVSQSR